jgi:D-alanyl-D-alanine carboxypeptidase
MKREIKFVAIALLIIIIGVVYSTYKKTVRHTSPNKQTGKSTTQTAVFDKTTLSVTDPASLWVVVNKQRPLQPADFVPADLVNPRIQLRLSASNEEMKLRQPAATALETMAAAAKSQGLSLMVASGYRSYKLQQTVYGNYVKTQGQATADTQSARPGFSEHQTGLAVDLEPASRICEVDQCFAQTPEGKWLASHAYEFGFVMRYQATTQSVVGYEYEPWHFRFVGKDLAAELHKEHFPPLETFFNLSAAPDYN